MNHFQRGQPRIGGQKKVIFREVEIRLIVFRQVPTQHFLDQFIEEYARYRIPLIIGIHPLPWDFYPLHHRQEHKQRVSKVK